MAGIVQADLRHACRPAERLPSRPVTSRVDRLPVGLAEHEIVVMPLRAGPETLFELLAAVSTESRLQDRGKRHSPFAREALGSRDHQPDAGLSWRACFTVRFPPVRSTALQGKPSASPWRSPRASATDHRAALRWPAAAASTARACCAVSGQISCRRTLGGSTKDATPGLAYRCKDRRLEWRDLAMSTGSKTLAPARWARVECRSWCRVRPLTPRGGQRRLG